MNDAGGPTPPPDDATAGAPPRSLARRLVTSWRRDYVLVALAAGLGLGLTALAWNASQDATRRRTNDYFDYRVRDAVERIEQRMGTYHQVLRGVEGLFTGSTVTRLGFRRYVDALRLDRNFSGIQGVGFSIAVPAPDLARHVAQVRSEGFPNYRVWPDGLRDRYSAIVYLEPFSDRNLRAFGYDMYSEPVRREAMDRACDRDEVSVSGKVTLVQETNEQAQAGFLMYVPLFNLGGSANQSSYADRATRRANLVGWVYAPFRMNDLMAGVFGEQEVDLDVEIYDGERLSPANQMFDNTPEDGRVKPVAPITSVRQLDIGGRRWTVVIGSRPGFETRLGSGSAATILGTGSLASLLLAVLTWTLVSRNRTLEARVAERTQALGESEEKYRVIFYNERVAICIFDLTAYRFIDVNPSFEALYGWSRGELLGGMTIRDISAEHERSERATERAKEEGTIFIPLRWHRKKDGTVFPVEIVGGPYQYLGRRVMFAMALDISVRIEAEAAAKSKAAELDRFFSHSLDLLCVADLDGCFRRLNPAWETTLGYSLEELVGRRFLDFVHPEDELATIETMAGLAQGTAVSGFVNRYRARDGSFRVLEWQSYPGDGLLYASARDVTHQWEAEKALRASEEKYAALFQFLPIGVSITDAAGALIETNAESEHLLGLTRSQHLDRAYDAPDWDIVRPDGSPMPPAEFASVRALAERRTIGDVEMGVRRPDGHLAWLLVSATPIPVEGYGVAIAYKDITDRVLTDRRIRESLREKESLLREIHHRVKNNMQVVSSLLDLQAQRIDDVAFKQVFLLAQGRVKAMALLHEKLYQTKDVANIDFADYLRDLADETMAAYGLEPPRIVCHTQSRGVRLGLDAAVPCGLVVNELLTNAFKHAFPFPRPGSVTIDLIEDSTRYVLTVCDDGIGLPEGFDEKKSPTLGLQLVGVLARQLRGGFTLTSDGGVRAEIVFPRIEERA